MINVRPGQRVTSICTRILDTQIPPFTDPFSEMRSSPSMILAPVRAVRK